MNNDLGESANSGSYLADLDFDGAIGMRDADILALDWGHSALRPQMRRIDHSIDALSQYAIHEQPIDVITNLEFERSKKQYAS